MQHSANKKNWSWIETDSFVFHELFRCYGSWDFQKAATDWIHLPGIPFSRHYQQMQLTAELTQLRCHDNQRPDLRYRWDVVVRLKRRNSTSKPSGLRKSIDWYSQLIIDLNFYDEQYQTILSKEYPQLSWICIYIWGINICKSLHNPTRLPLL